MTYAIDISHKSINKFGEELCGDHVEVANMDEGILVVLSDGLGSGVKANILAMLTSKIAITMLKEGATIDETLSTIMNTLPECQVRKLAYSTFTIVKVSNAGEVYMVEYDNPPAFYYNQFKAQTYPKSKRDIRGKTIYESTFNMSVEDTLTIVSDGAVHAGVGKTLNLGWQWEHISEYIESLVTVSNTSEQVTNALLSICTRLYDDHPGDDTTVLTIKLRERCYVHLFTGPPKNPIDDIKMIEELKSAPGKIIVCGGTTANIVSRALKEPIEVDLINYTPEVPPMGRMKGIDLVTEGLLTLNKTKDLLKEYIEYQRMGEIFIWDKHGAAKIARMLIEEATHVSCWVGQAINPAHQNPDFPNNFNLKNHVMQEIIQLLIDLGKEVDVHYT